MVSNLMGALSGRLARVAVLVLTLAVGGYTQATSQTGQPTFEVVSVKAMGPIQDVQIAGRGSTHNTVPFRYVGQHVTASHTLGHIIREAFSLSDWEVVGPDWIDSLVYQILAETAPGTDRATARLMIQSMLRDRFGFRAHRENKDLPQYILGVGKNGFKLRELTEPARSDAKMRSGEFLSTGSMDTQAAVFTNYAELPVINRTGISGIYHIELHWVPDDPAFMGRRFDSGFWAELERVTGLKVEKRRLPTSVLVIDHVDREPTAN